MDLHHTGVAFDPLAARGHAPHGHDGLTTPSDAGLVRPQPAQRTIERLRSWLGWFGVGRLATVVASVLAVGAGGYWLLRTPPAPVEAGLPRTTTSVPPRQPSPSTTSATTSGHGEVPGVPAAAGGAGPAVVADAGGTVVTGTDPGELVVHVAGAVDAPGVVRVRPGARVVDAVLAAGGFTPGADADAVNQAQQLHDGDRVYVPVVDEVAAVPVGVTPAAVAPVSSGAGGGLSPPAPVDLNGAAAADLEALPGVGPATAAAIVAHREQHGPFASVDDLADVRGIGPAKLEALRGLVVV